MTFDRPDYPLSRRAHRMRASEIRELLKVIERPGMTSFAGGIPEPSLFDVAAFREAYAEALTDSGASLQYSTSEGYPPLRQWIARMMTARGVACTEEHVLVTHGSQQALDLIGKLFLDPGDALVTAAPTYLGALQSFSAFDPAFVAMRFHADAVSESGPAKLVYLVPDFANPSGETLTVREREAALAFARRAGAIVVEDAAYADLRYEGESLPSMAALDIADSGSIDAARTLYCGTFSKTLSPGLRVGWVCGPAALIRRLTLIKQAADLHTATINQQVVHRIASTSFDGAVQRARALYAGRRDAMLAALDRHAPAGVGFTRPAGGLFVWLTLPPDLDSDVLLAKAMELNIAFVPGRAFFTDGSGANNLRLSFSLLHEEAIANGIGTLCGLLEVALRAGAAGGRSAA
ncbi:aminotransferase-like domain-containing protein [Oceanibacterium hippocampi]|uniref:2-aminoadipate transaminase n=1 Tax=Oceanibacterium hippocampi TaxID=745714 RepID=A0A1Y5ST46_9PROT|nr:PLP-dependent aminotransferase family protein [Oceanibacterium hippocampi]SLN47188.1 2-aminoadipate transaminase [Oceanibacterium hippocampi]